MIQGAGMCTAPTAGDIPRRVRDKQTHQQVCASEGGCTTAACVCPGDWTKVLRTTPDGEECWACEGERQECTNEDGQCTGLPCDCTDPEFPWKVTATSQDSAR